MNEKMTERKRHGWRIVFVLFVLILVASAASALLSTYGLTVTHYEVSSPKLTAPVRVVHLTDLHNSEFGEGNSRLIQKVAEQEPDLILITGDLLNSNEERADIAVSVIRKLAEISPVYVSLGNHEEAYEREYGRDLRSMYTDAGAVVLDFYVDEVSVHGQDLLIGGFYGYGMPDSIYEVRKEREISFLQSMEDQEKYTILLCHMPMSWLRFHAVEEWDIDCVLCGHVHGGQIRFPLIGGLWAPDQGWFPGEDCGMYVSEDGTRFMELSRGLGNTEKVPRFNNIPEIAVLDLMPEETGE